MMGIIPRFLSGSLLAIVWFTCCVAQTLVVDLRVKGIEVIAPGESGFGSASAPCEY